MQTNDGTLTTSAIDLLIAVLDVCERETGEWEPGEFSTVE